MAFYHVLDERVRALRRAGREVIGASHPTRSVLTHSDR